MLGNAGSFSAFFISVFDNINLYLDNNRALVVVSRAIIARHQGRTFGRLAIFSLLLERRWAD